MISTLSYAADQLLFQLPILTELEKSEKIQSSVCEVIKGNVETYGLDTESIWSERKRDMNDSTTDPNKLLI